MKTKNKSPYIHKNSVDNTHTEHSTVRFDLEQNAIKVISDDTLMFSKPVTIIDNSELWSGAKYDISTLDLSEYKGKLTADHRDIIQNILGAVIGVKKVANRKVTIDGIKLAVKENPLADYAKRMMLAGFLTDFSIETIGPWPDDQGIFKNSKVVGLSLVVTGNNKQAHINEIAKETLSYSKQNGLDTALFLQTLKLPIDKEKTLSDNDIDMKFKTVKNSRGFAIVFKFKNSAGADTEVTLQPNQSIEVIDNDLNKDVENQITNAVEPTPPAKPTTPDPKEEKKVSSEESITKAVQAAIAPLNEKIEKLEKTTFDNGFKEPEFRKPISTQTSNSLSALDYQERGQLQVMSALDFLVRKDAEAGRKLNEINKFHLQELQKAHKVRNSVTISDFGNFVISPELLSEIEGFRSNFGPLLAKVSFKDTLSLQMAWLTRSGDISMSEVEMCDDGENGNLKPISEYGATIKTSNLHELAAVTPVCNAATRFLAADILSDVAAGYRNDFDRKKAQLLIARLQQAVNETANVVHYNTTGGSSSLALQSFFAVGGMQEEIMGGTYIMSQASFWELASRKFTVGVNVDDGFSIFTKGPNGETMLLGAPVVVVPNELLPKLGSSETRSFVVEGVTITITSAVFYADLSTFSGRTSGGLNYDLSTEAAYEESGVVKSAFQRNELVLRGSFFRGGAIRDPQKVVGLEAVNLS